MFSTHGLKEKNPYLCFTHCSAFLWTKCQTETTYEVKGDLCLMPSKASSIMLGSRKNRAIHTGTARKWREGNVSARDDAPTHSICPSVPRKLSLNAVLQTPKGLVSMPVWFSVEQAMNITDFILSAKIPLSFYQAMTQGMTQIQTLSLYHCPASVLWSGDKEYCRTFPSFLTFNCLL